jgi:hypothetical protein
MENVLEIPTVIGAPFAGGFFAGNIFVNNVLYALIVAPKAEGEHKDAPWNKSTKSVEGALSYFDGLANTTAMAAAGSKLAQWALDLRIDGNEDWYLPSQDELEILYRNLKPTSQKNYLYSRSGINVSAAPPSYPYTPEAPAQTTAAAFQSGGEQAFADAWYWSSTQRASDSDFAWLQYFLSGGQNDDRKGSEFRARAIRRLEI